MKIPSVFDVIKYTAGRYNNPLILVATSIEKKNSPAKLCPFINMYTIKTPARPCKQSLKRISTVSETPPKEKQNSSSMFAFSGQSENASW